MKKSAYSVERIAYRKTKNTLFSLLSAIRYPLSAKTLASLFIVCNLWLMASPVEAAERFFELRAKKFSYTPNIIRVNKGDTVRIRLISEDVHHGFFLDGYGVRTSAHPGQEGSVKFTADKPGRFTFRCSVTCGEFHPYMVGYMIVGPNSRFWLYGGIVLGLGIISLLTTFSRKKQNVQG